jgi:hypothetical protein
MRVGSGVDWAAGAGGGGGDGSRACGGGQVAAARTAGARRWGRSLSRRYLVVKSGVLVHEEHRPVELAAGVYELRRQREYRPERSVWVAD